MEVLQQYYKYGIILERERFMRDLIRLFIVGAVMFFSPIVFGAAKYNVLILPDNIVTESIALDSYIYNQTSEFFANEIINLLNKTDYIKSPVVSDERTLLKSNPSYMIPARDLTNKFRTTYNIDYPRLKKIAAASNAKYVLLLTSAVDSENYILRRTVWDFLNIPGASVIDPAYKISTYAVLVDTNTNHVLWSNTFYKTISVVESRILTKGPSPQTEQLQKIRDYSRMLCPEIAENVQKSLLNEAEYVAESYKIYYDMANFDNVFTKKYRRWAKEAPKDFDGLKANVGNAKEKYNAKRAEKQKAKMEVKAEEYKDTAKTTTSETTTKVNPSVKIKTENGTKVIQPLDFEDQSLFDPVYLKRTKRNTLFGDYDPTRPELRDYENL